MQETNWTGAAWWVDATLWENSADRGPHRPTEQMAIAQVRRQAGARRRPLLRVIVMLERWYHDRHPEVIPFARLQLIARRLDMTIYQVDAALHEADLLAEAGGL